MTKYYSGKLVKFLHSSFPIKLNVKKLFLCTSNGIRWYQTVNSAKAEKEKSIQIHLCFGFCFDLLLYHNIFIQKRFFYANSYITLRNIGWTVTYRDDKRNQHVWIIFHGKKHVSKIPKHKYLHLNDFLLSNSTRAKK